MSEFQACGVDFEVKTYLAMEKSNPDEKIEKKWVFVYLSPLGNHTPLLTSSCMFCRRDTARLIIRKIQYAPTQVGAGPKAEICKNFMMSDKPVHVEASLDKDVQWQNLLILSPPAIP